MHWFCVILSNITNEKLGQLNVSLNSICIFQKLHLHRLQEWQRSMYCNRRIDTQIDEIYTLRAVLLFSMPLPIISVPYSTQSDVILDCAKKQSNEMSIPFLIWNFEFAIAQSPNHWSLAFDVVLRICFSNHRNDDDDDLTAVLKIRRHIFTDL